MQNAFDLFSWRGRVTRLQFIVTGLLLLVIKYGIDLAVSEHFHHPWHPLMYVSPRLNPLFRPEEVDAAYTTAMLAVAVPFVVIGLSLTARRVRDMGLNPIWAGLFFLPFLHFAFFLVIAVAPGGRASAVTPDSASGDPYRVPEEKPVPSAAAPSSFLTRILPQRETGAFLFAVLLSLAFGLAAYVLTQQVDRTLGTTLFFGMPFGVGFLSAFCTRYVANITRGRAVLYALSTMAVGLAVLVALAWEGLACIAMASPILAAASTLGALFGEYVARTTGPRRVVAAITMALLPPLLVAEAHSHPSAQAIVVTTEATVNAPIETVWRNVVAPPPMDAPPNAVFAIVTMPVDARIAAEGVGNERTSHFTSGVFREEIVSWVEPRDLTFAVKQQPPALDHYLRAKQGRFSLVDRGNGTTLLRATTEIDLRVYPGFYWGWWSEVLIHAIHGRVLNHVKDSSEHPDMRREPRPLPSWLVSAQATCKCTRSSGGNAL